MSSLQMKLGFVAAAMMNIGGVLVFSKGLNNPVLNAADPVVMSNFGLVMIMVWGLAYLGAAFVREGIAWLAGAFAVEKLVYVVAWVVWQANHSLSEVYQGDVLAGIFYSIYGLNDLAFMLFFAWVCVASLRSRTS